MDTRLKNRHKMAVVLIAATIVLLAYHITSYYGIYNQMMKENQEETEKQMLLSEDFLGQFLQASWILYEREDEDRPNGDGLRGGSFLPAEIQNEYETFYPYLEYVMKDRKGEVMATSLGNSSGDFDHYRITTYAVGLTLVYDQNGEADVEIATREHKSELERGFREVLNRLENGSYRGYTKEDLYYAMPEDCLVYVCHVRGESAGLSERNLLHGQRSASKSGGVSHPDPDGGGGSGPRVSIR